MSTEQDRPDEATEAAGAADQAEVEWTIRPRP